VNKPSDDPVAASRELFSRVEQRGSEQYVKNLNYAKSFLDFSEQSLNELTEVLMRAKELSIAQASDGGSSPQSRRIVAEEIKQLHNQAVQIANRKLGERFIFAGFKTTQTPFDENGNYSGDTGEMKIHIDKDSFLAMNIPGEIVFQGKGLSKDGFSFRSLQQPKNMRELAAEKAQHPERYDLKEGSVEAADAGAAAAAKTGESTPTRGPASLRQTEAAAEKTKSGASATANSFASRDSKNAMKGEAYDVTGEASSIVYGEDGVQGENVFQALKKLEIALVTDDKTGIQESMDRLDDSLQQVVVARTSLGSRVMSIDNTLNSMHTNIVDTKGTISQLEDADAFEVISDINKTESALQATLQTSGKMIQKSLLDFVS
jgi:flagellar hook-associated protein 3 FlgL